MIQEKHTHHGWSDYLGRLGAAGAHRFQFFLSFPVAVIVIGFSVYYRSELLKTLLRVNLWWVCVGLLCYGVNYILRAFRLRIISGCRIIFWPNAIYASSLHGFMTYLIPLQAGDVSLPIILKAANGIDLSDGSAILIRTRLLDISTMGGLMLVAASSFDIPLALSFRLIWFIVGCVLVIVPFLLRRLIASKWLQSQRFGGILKPFTQAGGFSIIEFLLSLAIWIAVGSVFFCVVKAINLPIGFGGIWLLISIQLPLQMIPVQGVANTGNHEGGWIAALTLLGIPLSQSAEFAVTSHVIILFYVLALGIGTSIVGKFK